MYCPNCGTELPENAPVCPSCGTAIQNGAPSGDNNGNPSPVFTGFETLKRVFSSGLFLFISILITATAALSLIDGTINVYAILGTIACWIIFANAKSETVPLKQSGYKFAAVITKIMYVVNWVLIGIFTVCGALASAIIFLTDDFLDQLLTYMNNNFPEDYYELMNKLQEAAAELSDIISENEFVSYLSVFLGITVAAFIVIAVVALLIYNLCFVKHLNRYTHSLSDSFATGNVTVYNKSLATRFLVFGIIGAVFSIGSIADLFGGDLSAAGTLCGAAVPIICSVLLNSAKEEQ